MKGIAKCPLIKGIRSFFIFSDRGTVTLAIRCLKKAINPIYGGFLIRMANFLTLQFLLILLQKLFCVAIFLSNLVIELEGLL